MCEGRKSERTNAGCQISRGPVNSVAASSLYVEVDSGGRPPHADGTWRLGRCWRLCNGFPSVIRPGHAMAADPTMNDDEINNLYVKYLPNDEIDGCRSRINDRRKNVTAPPLSVASF